LDRKNGSGIKRILKALQIAGLPTPVFENIQHGFRVTLFKSLEEKTTQKTTQKTTLDEQILNVIRTNSTATRTEIAEVLGLSPNTVKEYLAKLKKAGRLSRSGSDRRGDWVVNEEDEKKMKK
jgi:ATP-dependent DNA helicase RecG